MPTIAAVDKLAREIAGMIGRDFDDLADTDKEKVVKSARWALEQRDSE